MSDAKLFRFNGQSARALPSHTAKLEKELQALIEGQMDVFLGVRFLATEYSTGKTHKGRIDSLGLDENGCPVIIEYKRHSNENVINQGLFYLDWLLDHQAEFRWLVMEQLGKDTAEAIEWSGTRLICIASDFNKYDEHAVQQINRNIELVRYRYFGEDLLLLDLVNAQTASGQEAITTVTSKAAKAIPAAKSDWTHKAALQDAPEHLKALYDELCDYADSLGDVVQRKELKLYTAFKRIRNFACICLTARKDPQIKIWLNLCPGDLDLKLELEAGFARDVTNTGHWGTGDLELTVRTASDLEKAKPLIEQSYQQG